MFLSYLDIWSDRNLSPCSALLLLVCTCFCYMWMSELQSNLSPCCILLLFECVFSVRFGCLKCSETSFIILFAYCLNVHVPVTLGCVKCKEALISSFDFARNPLAMQSKFSKQLQTTACNCANGGRQPSNQANKLNKVTVNTIGFYSREGVYQ